MLSGKSPFSSMEQGFPQPNMSPREGIRILYVLGEAHHLLILHGRYTCLARKPKCEACPLPSVCLYYERLQKLPLPLNGLDPKIGKYFCKTHDGYFDAPATKEDRHGVQQIACPACGSMNVFLSKTGQTTKKVRDFRVN